MKGFNMKVLAEFVGLDVLVRYNKPVVYVLENSKKKKVVVYWTSKFMRHLKDKIIDRVYTEGYEELYNDLPDCTIKILEEHEVYNRLVCKVSVAKWKEWYTLQGYTFYGKKKKPKYYDVYTTLYEWKNRVYNTVIMKDTLSNTRTVLGLFRSISEAYSFMNLYYPEISPEQQPFVPYIKKDGTLGKREVTPRKLPRQYITTVYAGNDDTKAFYEEYGNSEEFLTKNSVVNPFVKKVEDRAVYTGKLKPFTEDDYRSIKDEYFSEKPKKEKYHNGIRLDNDCLDNDE